MPITDPYAIKFCNQQARPNADVLAQSYYLCDGASDRWSALGGGQPAIDVMEVDIRTAADLIVNTYSEAFIAEKTWFLGLNVTITNDAESILDGSPEDGRPAATGSDIHAVMARVIEVQNWLFSATQSFTDSARNNSATYNTIIAASFYGDPVLSVADAGNFINRCNELVANYEANTNTNLNDLLAIAVNPRR